METQGAVSLLASPQKDVKFPHEFLLCSSSSRETDWSSLFDLASLGCKFKLCLVRIQFNQNPWKLQSNSFLFSQPHPLKMPLVNEFLLVRFQFNQNQRKLQSNSLIFRGKLNTNVNLHHGSEDFENCKNDERKYIDSFFLSCLNHIHLLLQFLVYHNTALFATFLDSSAHSSVRHGCDISTFLNGLMVWTMKTIYFLNTYQLGWSSWPPGPPGSPGTPGTPEHSNHPDYSDDLDYVDHLDHLDMDYLVNLYHLDHLHRMFSTLHSPSFHSSINLTRPCRSLGPPGPSFHPSQQFAKKVDVALSSFSETA